MFECKKFSSGYKIAQRSRLEKLKLSHINIPDAARLLYSEMRSCDWLPPRTLNPRLRPLPCYKSRRIANALNY
jgi:hypothetical protein